MSKPVCTCTHEVTPQHGHDRTCAKGLYAWNSWHKTKVRKLDAENERLRQRNRELRARVRELERSELRLLRERDGACPDCGAPPSIAASDMHHCKK